MCVIPALRLKKAVSMQCLVHSSLEKTFTAKRSAIHYGNLIILKKRANYNINEPNFFNIVWVRCGKGCNYLFLYGNMPSSLGIVPGMPKLPASDRIEDPLLPFVFAGTPSIQFPDVFGILLHLLTKPSN